MHRGAPAGAGAGAGAGFVQVSSIHLELHDRVTAVSVLIPAQGSLA